MIENYKSPAEARAYRIAHLERARIVKGMFNWLLSPFAH